MNNTIVAKNTNDFSSNAGYGDMEISGNNNLIGLNGGAGSYGVNITGSGNIVGTVANPIDPGIADPTQREDGSWLYGALLLGSPAIDAGNNDFALGDTDVFGDPRIQNGTINIGAIEGTILAPRSGVTYYVTSLEDTIGQEGVLTFREAFEAANGNIAVGNAPAGSYSEKDTIIFAPGLAGTIRLDNLELDILGSLDIFGSGAELLVFDARGTERIFGGVFKIKPGIIATLSGMTITDGYAYIGGGIYNDGMLTVADCVISKNSIGTNRFRRLASVVREAGGRSGRFQTHQMARR